MFTKIKPALAAAYWVMVHSTQFGAQIPMRSPGFKFSESKPCANPIARASNCANVQAPRLTRSTPPPPGRAKRLPHG